MGNINSSYLLDTCKTEQKMLIYLASEKRGVSEMQDRRKIVGDILHDVRTLFVWISGLNEAFSSLVEEIGPGHQLCSRIELVVATTSSLAQEVQVALEEAEHAEEVTHPSIHGRLVSYCQMLQQLAEEIKDQIAGCETATFLEALVALMQQRMDKRHRLVPLSSLIQWVMEAALPDFTHKGMQLSSDVHMCVLVDNQLVLRTLLNLLGNVTKHCPAGCTAHISTRFSGDGRVIIKVRDTGNGISEINLGRVFEDGFSTSRTQASGTGLSSIKLLLEAHGGQIGVESQPGQGTTFWFTVPYKDALAESAAA